MTLTLQDLPGEILTRIAEWLHQLDEDLLKADWRPRFQYSLFRLRLVSRQIEAKLWHTFAHTHFRTQATEITYPSLQRLLAISKDTRLAPVVRKLELQSRNMTLSQVSRVLHESLTDDRADTGGAALTKKKGKLLATIADENYLKRSGYAKEMLLEAFRAFENCTKIHVFEKHSDDLEVQEDGHCAFQSFDAHLWNIAKQLILDTAPKVKKFIMLASHFAVTVDPSDFYIPHWQLDRFRNAFSTLTAFSASVAFGGIGADTFGDDFVYYVRDFLNMMHSLQELSISVTSNHYETIGRTIMEVTLEGINLPHLRMFQSVGAKFNSDSLNGLLRRHPHITEIILTCVTMSSWKSTLQIMRHDLTLNKLSIIRPKTYTVWENGQPFRYDAPKSDLYNHNYMSDLRKSSWVSRQLDEALEQLDLAGPTKIDALVWSDHDDEDEDEDEDMTEDDYGYGWEDEHDLDIDDDEFLESMMW